ncbi:hypothetical protein B0H66DRAFT_529994 [Apodospora peruviana]|uniref:Uncharacterized protein n=1 Tax=Apodospora peruviana TaxID=516989 RepID=A0AAE0MCH3_9PEZI|nr:hypothetical protein B0H66DRAFT_529994 [Apodospora peruviana]
MVSLDVVKASNRAVVKKQPITAVFVGATQGIGEYALRQLALAHGSSGQGLRIYLVGRKEGAARTILSEAAVTCPGGDFRFIPTEDISLLNEVDRVCAEIARAEAEAVGSTRTACVDLLVMTQAYFAVGDQMQSNINSEGLESSLSLLYYSRMRFIMQLLPLLTASPLAGRVVSVFGGPEAKLDLDNLALLKPGTLGFLTQGSHTTWMTTLLFERLAAQHRGKLSLNHYFPGYVLRWDLDNRPGLTLWFKILSVLLWPIILLIRVGLQESGERVIYHTSDRFAALPAGNTVGAEIAKSTDGIPGGGAYKVGTKGDITPLPKVYSEIDKEETSQKIWDHTMKAFEDISAGRKFSP